MREKIERYLDNAMATCGMISEDIDICPDYERLKVEKDTRAWIARRKWRMAWTYNELSHTIRKAGGTMAKDIPLPFDLVEKFSNVQGDKIYIHLKNPTHKREPDIKFIIYHHFRKRLKHFTPGSEFKMVKRILECLR